MPPHLALDPPVVADAHYFTVEELRAAQDLAGSISDESAEEMRDLAEEVIEQGAGVAFIPRRTIERAYTLPSGVIRLDNSLARSIEGLTVDEDEWDTDEIADRITLSGRYVLGLAGCYGRNVVVTYDYGYEAPPRRIRRAAMILTRVWLNSGPVDDRAIQLASDGATINLATPGKFGSYTGIPEVDAAISSYSHFGYLG